MKNCKKNLFLFASIISLAFSFDNIYSKDSNKKQKKDKKYAIVLIGAPASGKGYLAKKISSERHYTHISTGEILRQNNNDEHQEQMKNGHLLNDQDIQDTLEKHLSKTKIDFGVLFDGVPRRKSQVKILSKIMKHNKIKLLKVVVLSCDDKTLISRMEKRALESKQKREDDNLDIFKKRLEIYNKESTAIIDFYKKKKNLVTFVDCQNADKFDINELFKKVDQKKLKKEKKNQIKK